MKKIIAIMALCAVALSSCTKDTAVDNSAADSVLFTIGEITPTRATEKAAWANGDAIGIYMFDSSGSTIFNNVKYEYNGSEWSVAEGEEAIYYKVSNATFVAYYPYDESNSTSSIPVSMGTDLLRAEATEKSSGDEVELQFNHMMSSVSIEVEASEFVTNISDVTIELTPYDSATYNLWGGSFSDISTSDSATLSYSAGTLVDDESYTIESLLLIPDDYTTVEISATLSSGAKYTATIGETLASDTKYSFTLSVGEDGLEISLDGELVWTETTGSTTDLSYNFTNWIEMAADSYGSDNGSSYDIDTAAQLAKLALDVNSGNNTFEGKVFYQVSDIDLKSIPWTPIGTSERPFKGKFINSQYSISNLYINSSENNQGLFGYVEDATIENLIVTGEVTGAYCVGGVVGTAVDSTISDCTTTGVTVNYIGLGGEQVGYSYTTTEE
ncbi:MAG: fimbrillin family protein [Rikenellaceae bacterium]